MTVASEASPALHSPAVPEIPLSRPEAEAAVRQLLDQGQVFFAHDLAQSALRQFPDSVRLKQALARALLRAGALPEAQATLEELCRMASPGEDAEETQGLLARVYKDLWKRSGAPEDAHRARDAYLRGFQESRGLWTGINAATMSWIVGDRAQATRLARQVLVLGAGAPPDDVSDQYWWLATLGEAQLLLGDTAEAEDAYAQAAAVAGRRHALVAASRQQLRLLAAHGFSVPTGLFDILRPPTVVVFGGPMLDQRGQSASCFPAAEDAVRDDIVRHLEALDARIGYSSAACGADLLFVEAMQARGAEVHIVLPCARDDFQRACVAFAGPEWVARFERALARADSIRAVTEESVQGDDTVFALMSRMLRGYAVLAAQTLDASPTLLAVWDGRPATGVGGTADLVSGWPDESRRVIIPLSNLPERPLPSLQDDSVSESAPKPVRRQIGNLLFADVVGYSRLQEDRMPAFMFHFLQRVAAHLPRTPRFVNTWGDAIFAITDSATALAEYALALQEVVCDTDWAEFGLPGAMSIRIGLHAGPIFEGVDPITGQINYYGAHVNRAARLESVTVAGNVYASEQFAALLTSEQQGLPPAFACDYIGTLALSKNSGFQPTFHLRRRQHPD